MTVAAAQPRYTGVAIVLHWTIAVLIAINLFLVWTVDKWPASWTRPFIDTHKSIGITVLGLVLLRLLWRASHPPPPLPDGYPRWERQAAHIAHIGLYLLILGIPLSGWLHDSAWKDGPTHPDKLFWLIPGRASHPSPTCPRDQRSISTPSCSRCTRGWPICCAACSPCTSPAR